MPTMHIRSIEAGTRIKILAGVHTGCWELRASDSVNRVLDLKGKRIGIWAPNDHPHVFLELIVNYVGLDPARDVEWVVGHPMQDFVDGKVDAFLADPTELPKADFRKDRTYRSQQPGRPSLVGVFLLHDCGECRLYQKISGCDQACVASSSEVCRFLRVVPIRGGTRVVDRGLPQLRGRLCHTTANPARQVAGLRRRRIPCASMLCVWGRQA